MYFWDEAKNLALDSFTAFNVAPITERHTEMVAEELTRISFWLPRLGLPCTMAAEIKDSDFYATTFSKKKADEIIKATKKRGCTHTRVMNTALMLATKKLRNNIDARFYQALTAFNPTEAASL